jgi:hypothetical protein
MSMVERVAFFAANLMVLAGGAVFLNEHGKAVSAIIGQASAAFH